MKINVKHAFGTADYIVLIDDQGRVWKQQASGTVWRTLGSIPDEPEEPSEAQNLNIDLTDDGPTAS